MESKTVVLIEPVAEGTPEPSHFSIQPSTVDVESLQDGGIVVKAMSISADPYLRGQIKPTGAIKAGSPMSGFIAGEVIASKSDKWKVGDLIGASLPFSTVQIVSKEALSKTISWKLTDHLSRDNISHGIGVLGMPGSTAYGGLTDVLKVKEGETIFISAAAGAVGSLVGMIAKRQYNCTVIGSCGGPEKCALIKEKFGFDHAIDYKQHANAESLTAALKEVAPNGIDMYFENVGGMHFDAAMASLRKYGRVAVCGMISQYNKGVAEPVSFEPMKMIYSFQRVEGFMCMPWLSGQQGNFLEDMAKWLGEGKLVVQETHFSGIEQWPEAFQSLFSGANKGKVVVDI